MEKAKEKRNWLGDLMVFCLVLLVWAILIFGMLITMPYTIILSISQAIDRLYALYQRYLREFVRFWPILVLLGGFAKKYLKRFISPVMQEDAPARKVKMTEKDWITVLLFFSVMFLAFLLYTEWSTIIENLLKKSWFERYDYQVLNNLLILALVLVLHSSIISIKIILDRKKELANSDFWGDMSQIDKNK